MDWKKIKEFLKPDWRKLLLFLIFLFLGLLFGALLYDSESTLSVFGFIVFNFPAYLGYLIEQPSDLIIVTVYLINYLFYYIISCIVVWIYDNRKIKS